MDDTPPASRDDFRVAILCALPCEADAVLSVLDCVWSKDSKGRPFAKRAGDLNNTYVNGRIGPHNVVVVLLPGRMGKVSSATVGVHLSHSYPKLRLTLLVGICGGVPSANGREVVLGDVVISSSVVQYDFGRMYPDGFRRKNQDGDNLNAPDKEISGVLAMLGTTHGMRSVREGMLAALQDLQEKEPQYLCPGAATDRLFPSGYRHKHQAAGDCDVCESHKDDSDQVCNDALNKSCDELGCDLGLLVKRSRLEAAVASSAAVDPVIHVGRVATGDTVMKSGVLRDAIASREEAIAFEMEAAGIWEHLSSLVVKGVCDYADSHKNKNWQNYAAATAAAAAKALLRAYIPTEAEPSTPADQPVELKWLVPFPPDPSFVDEPDIMQWISEKAQVPGNRAALVGLGGVGKTQLAIQYAHRVRHTSHVFWVNASTRASFQDSYADMAETLGLGLDENSADATLRKVAHWLAREQNGRWTVVLDNFDDPSALFPDDLSLSKVLPLASHGFTLITSSTDKAAEVLTGSTKHIRRVSAMSEDRAVALLRTKLEAECGEEDGRELARLLDCFPLAMTQAAAYINRRHPRISVREYTDMFKAGDGRGRLLGAKYTDLRRYSDAPNSVLDTWIVIFQQIKKERPSAIGLLSLMSCFNPQSIPVSILKLWYSKKIAPPVLRRRDISTSPPGPFRKAFPLTRHYHNRVLSPQLTSSAWLLWLHPYLNKYSMEEFWKDSKDSLRKWFSSSSSKTQSASQSELDEDGDIIDAVAALGADEALEQDLETLRGYSLVSPTEDSGLLKTHRLVKDCTQEWLMQSGRLETWKRRFMMVMSYNYSRVLAKSPSIRHQLTGHAEPLLNDDPKDPLSARVWLEIMDAVAFRWARTGRDEEASRLRKRLVAVAEELLGEDDYATLQLLDTLALQLFYAGDHEGAEATFTTLRRRREAIGDRDSPLALESQAFYVEVLTKLGRTEEAEQAARSLAEQRARALGEKAAGTLHSTALLAQVLAAKGKHEEACDIMLRLIGEDWPQTSSRERSLLVQTSTALGMTLFTMLDAMPAEKLEPRLRAMVERVESFPEKCRELSFQQGPVFHTVFAFCLSQVGKHEEAGHMLNRGLRTLSTCFLDPAVQLPQPVESLLQECAKSGSSGGDGKDRGGEEGRLLREAIEHLRTEKGKVAEQVYQALTSVARYLYLKHRPAEGSMLLEALGGLSEEAYGRDHWLTRDVLNIWAEQEGEGQERGHKKEGRPLASRESDQQTLVEGESE